MPPTVRYRQEHVYFTSLQAKGLSRMRGNPHVRFLGGWRVVTLSGYPVVLGGVTGRKGWENLTDEVPRRSIIVR